jgi:type VI protein secretion system component VasK
MLLASEFGTGQVFWSMLWFFMFFIWIIILFQVFADIFRSHDIGGWTKALWSIFIIIVPFFGVFIYLIARGGKMQEHATKDAQAMDQAQRAYIQQAAGTDTSDADQLDKLAALHTAGKIDDTEYAAAKAKVLGS